MSKLRADCVTYMSSLVAVACFLAVLMGPAGVSFPVSAGEPASDDLYVLSIGVGYYKDKRIPRLHYSDDDAIAIANWAATQEGKIYRKVHTRLLVDEDATRGDIIRELFVFLGAAEPADQIILFFAGHGVLEPNTGAYHFLPFDAMFDNIAGTGLEQDDILQTLLTGKRTHERVLVLVDTCHAGALSEALSQHSEGRGLFTIAEVEPLEDSRVEDRANLWAIFTAGTARAVAREGASYRLPNEPEEIYGHGVFTYAVLRALGSTDADRDKNGAVTLTEFLQFVTSVVKKESQDTQFPIMTGKLVDVALAWAVGTVEICDGIDNDMNGRVDDGFPDKNRNGIADCLDVELCNGIDDNNDGQIDEGFDLDLDGYNSMDLCGSQYGNDCDDDDISIHPDQTDWGNLRDDDCDGLVDENDHDTNGDGVPDLMESRVRQMSMTRWISLGAGVALAAAGAVSYSRLLPLQPEAVGNSFVSPEELRQYQRWSVLTAVLGGSGLATVGISFTFTLKEIRFKADHYPKTRKLKVQPVVSLRAFRGSR